MKRRLMLAASFAATAAFVLLTIVTAANCFPLCALYTPDNPEWYLFACWSCAP